jgi:hypothetical protein
MKRVIRKEFDPKRILFDILVRISQGYQRTSLEGAPYSCRTDGGASQQHKSFSLQRKKMMSIAQEAMELWTKSKSVEEYQ